MPNKIAYKFITKFNISFTKFYIIITRTMNKIKFNEILFFKFLESRKCRKKNNIVVK